MKGVKGRTLAMLEYQAKAGIHRKKALKYKGHYNFQSNPNSTQIKTTFSQKVNLLMLYGMHVKGTILKKLLYGIGRTLFLSTSFGYT